MNSPQIPKLLQHIRQLPQKYIFLSVGLLLLLVTGTMLYQSYTQQTEAKHLTFPAALTGTISAYTHGEISRTSPVIVQFAHNMVSHGTDLQDQPFSFSPHVKGKAEWVDERTLQFFPENPLATSQVYRASLDLSELAEQAEGEPAKFHFQFKTREQAFNMLLTDIQTLDQQNFEWQRVRGKLVARDYIDENELKPLLQAKLGRQKLAISWEEMSDQFELPFIIDSIPRTHQSAELELKLMGSKIQPGNDKNERVSIPALGVFTLTHVRNLEGKQKGLALEFSDPLTYTQELTGLIQLDGAAITHLIDGNTVFVYPKKPLSGMYTLHVSAGITNVHGAPTQKALHKKVVFEDELPAVRLVGKGAILPQAEKLPFIFETYGLKAVDVRVIKILEKNIPQFFQANRMDEHNELKRVGEPILSKRIDLEDENALDMNSWLRHSLDLSTLISPDPGAIYEVALGFRRSYTSYSCTEEEGEKDMLALPANWDTYTGSYESSFWDYYYYSYRDYNDPCKRAYYQNDRVAKRNILASDLGILAKRGEKEVFYTVTDLKNTEPLQGVKLEVYSYQNKLTGTYTTDSLGQVRTSYTDRPYLLIAKQGKQRGYLRMDDGSALSISRFDTDGQALQEGIKGYFYGERGVWRPGDEIFLTFILEDKENRLPNNHPVSFELKSPEGKTVVKEVSTGGINSFYAFSPTTEANAPTGTYLASAKVGNQVFRKSISVETVVPNRLKLNLDLPVKSLSNNTQRQQGTLQVKWLHGAPASGLRAEVKAKLSTRETSFPKYRDFNFDDPARKFSSEEMVLFEGDLDDQGEKTFPISLKANKSAPGKLRANFSLQAFENGGGFSRETYSIDFDPYEVYIGVKTPKGDQRRGMLLTDQDHTVEIATVDVNGNPVSSKGIKLQLYKLKWRWWWDQNGSDNLINYKGEVNAEEIETATLNTVNGLGSWKLRIDYPAWGRYLIRVEEANGHVSGKIIYIDWPGWAGKGRKEGMGGAAMLQISADKPSYQVGETVTLDIPGSFNGKALISLERGHKVLETKWIDVQEGNTKYSFTAMAEMTPNLYASVILLQPHAQTKNDLPIRMYGVVPIEVVDPTTRIQPKLQMAASLKPMQPYQVKVSEATGKPMTYTLAVVDEGLLGLTRFNTPNPWDHFYQKEALKVRTWDIYDYVLGVYSGKINTLLSIGGGRGDQAPDLTKLNRFKPVVEYIGPFTLEAGQTKSHSLNMPNYVGAVRAMVVAGTPEGAYGQVEKSVPVTQELMVLGNLPRVLRPSETLRLPVTVFARKDGLGQVNVSVGVGKKLKTFGPAEKNILMNKAGERTVFFGIDSKSLTGTEVVNIAASNGSYRATYKVDIELEEVNPPVSSYQELALGQGEKKTLTYSPAGKRGSNVASLEVSAIPPMNLNSRLRFLLRYPYGCIEQTTSTAFPLVWLNRLIELDKGKRDRADNTITAAIKRLELFQTVNGGLSYWPGQPTVSLWGTNYAGHFLLEAKEAGYDVPEKFYKKWLAYQQKMATNWSPAETEDQLIQAYRLYLLAKAGKANLGAMNRLKQQPAGHSMTQWMLGTAYHLAGRKKVAAEITDGLDFKAHTYKGYSRTYGTPLRDQAIMLLALSEMDQRGRATAVVKAITAELGTEKWLNTQALGFSLVAMGHYVGKEGLNQELTFSYKVGNSSWKKIDSEKGLFQYVFANAEKGAEIQFRNQGEGLLYARLLQEGIPTQADTTSYASNIKLNVRYLALNGAEIDIRKVRQGTDFIVETKVTHTGLGGIYKELALNQMIPSGWQIYNHRLEGKDPGGDTPDYQDIRDDRVYTFFELKKGKSKTFRFMVNASYQGSFYHPLASVEAMYDRSIYAKKAGFKVDVIDADSAD